MAAILMLGALGWLAVAQPMTAIAPADAARFEGQAPVRIAGLAMDIQPRADSTDFMLVSGAAGVAVHATGHPAIAEGAWTEAEGSVLRQAGRLTLWATGDGAVRRLAGPDPEQPSWAQIAADPRSWYGHAIRIAGTIDRGTIGDRDGHRMQLGNGPWPRDGSVQAVGTIAYEPACLCERFAANTVRAGP